MCRSAMAKGRSKILTTLPMTWNCAHIRLLLKPRTFKRVCFQKLLIFVPNVPVWYTVLFPARLSEPDTMKRFTVRRHERYETMSRAPLEYKSPQLFFPLILKFKLTSIHYLSTSNSSRSTARLVWPRILPFPSSNEIVQEMWTPGSQRTSLCILSSKNASKTL